MARLLLIGNSRWHWAEYRGSAGGLRCWHTAPAELVDPEGLQAWAAVGSLPPSGPPSGGRRLRLADVPLQGAPPWLGMDRALVGWWAWRQREQAVLVADAGTALSLTRVDSQGRFAGGLISAGVALQLKALAGSTAQLPALSTTPASSSDRWPQATEPAMAEGCRRAVAAAIMQAWQAAGPINLWLTGGDAELLLPVLGEQQLSPKLAPDLALEAMAALPVVGLLS